MIVETFGVFIVWFSNTLPRGDANLGYSFIWLQRKGNISLPKRYSYRSILPDDNADIFAASPSISYCVFSSVVIVTFYILAHQSQFDNLFETDDWLQFFEALICLGIFITK